VRILSGGALLATPFIDLSDRVFNAGERGLLGLAFPPGYAQKGYFYLHYSRLGDGASVLSRFFVSADPNLALPASEQVLLLVDQPFANHNGGQLAFGPDGLLYVALGDGGSAGDPFGNGQNPASLLGSLLRLDVEGGALPYAIPPDNPFVGLPNARPEIWAIGLRNPWRFSFDRLSGDLFIADVGQNTWEEINHQPGGAAGGANYGWNILEGPDCFSPAEGCVPPAAAVAPVASYDHGLGCSVTGGYVYRGPQNPDLQGLYFYADFCSGRLWGLRRVGATWENQLLAETGRQISSFGEDEAGRLYLADYGSGTILRIDQQ
jgi:glucose/arabinose dehydrogenase